MKVKRQPYAIASEMLYVALAGVHKTRLMYSCNLSHGMCDKYVTSLLRKGLLEKKEDVFHTTEKGIQFIKTYKELERLWKNNMISRTVQRSLVHRKKKLGFMRSLT